MKASIAVAFPVAAATAAFEAIRGIGYNTGPATSLNKSNLQLSVCRESSENILRDMKRRPSICLR
jgi:hypothetical protein